MGSCISNRQPLIVYHVKVVIKNYEKMCGPKTIHPLKLKLDDKGQATYVAMQLNILKNKKMHPIPHPQHHITKQKHKNTPNCRKHVLPILHIYNIA